MNKLIPSHERALDELARTDRVPAGYGSGMVHAIRARHAEQDRQLEIAGHAAAADAETIKRLQTRIEQLEAKNRN